MHPLGDAPYQPSATAAPAGGGGIDSPVPGELTVTAATLEQWRQVEEWAAEEEWNPGIGDSACFHPTDPTGFFIGHLAGRPVSAVSVVAYDEHFAFLGYYLVHPEHRGRGLGLATWRAAVPHAGQRVIGLDAVPAQQATYRRSGFTDAYRTERYCGHLTPGGAPSAQVVPVTADHLAAVAAYDRQCFPAARSAFVSRWLTASGHTAYAHLSEGRVTGYAVARAARKGQRIGPLFADTKEGAAALLDALAEHIGPGEEVFIDIPGPHSAALALAASRGLAPHSHTVRMYTGPVPRTRTESVYGVTSLELG